MIELTHDETWPRAYFMEGNGVGLSLHIKSGRLLSDTERSAINRAMHEIERDIAAETARLDPDNIAWKASWLIKVREMFATAGLSPVYVKEIDNEYCGPKCCPHRVWLLVTTPLGVIKIGWRKRVIEIDWSGSDIGARGDDLFAGENVTTGVCMVHAYGYEKATECLTKLATWEPGDR